MNDCDYDKRTALHVAASEGHIEIVRTLLKEGADVNFADRYNTTPLDGMSNTDVHFINYHRCYPSRAH